MGEQHLEIISKKLNVLIALSLRNLLSDTDFVTDRKGKRGTGAMVNYLADLGLDAKDIATILGAPLQSVRTLLTPNRRK